MLKKVIIFFMLSIFSVLTFGAEKYQEDILKYVNKERKNISLKPLKLNEKLNRIAIIKAKDMAEEKTLSHTSKKFGTTFELLKKEKIKYSAAAENIAKGHSTPEFVMERWMKSSGHRANILGENYEEIGIGRAVDSDGKLYWVQVFIKNKSKDDVIIIYK